MAEKAKKTIPWFLILALFCTVGVIVFEKTMEQVEADSNVAKPIVEVGNVAPTVSAVNITSGTITLTENTTTTVTCEASTTDQNGWADIATATAIIFREGAGTGCSEDDNNCYYVSSTAAACDFLGTTTNTRTVSCSAHLWFHADPTDASSSWSGETWWCQVRAIDIEDAFSTATDTTPSELGTQYALIVDSPINYGTLSPGASSTATSTKATTTGNSAIDLNLYGVDMASGTTYTIPVGNQEYASSSFTHSGGTSIDLAVTPGINYNLELGKPTSHPSTSSDDIYWSLYVDTAQETGIYDGTNTISAVTEE